MAEASFDGQPIVKNAVKITGAGDGLSEALSADGIALHMGQQVTVILECEVNGADLRSVDKDDATGPLVAKYVLKATGRATLADEGAVDVALLLTEQEARVRAARGEEQLPGFGAAPPEAADAIANAGSTDPDGYYDPEAVDPS